MPQETPNNFEYCTYYSLVRKEPCCHQEVTYQYVVVATSSGWVLAKLHQILIGAVRPQTHVQQLMSHNLQNIHRQRILQLIQEPIMEKVSKFH